MRDWTYSKSISAVETHTVQYRKVSADGEIEILNDAVEHAAVAETFTNYTTLSYIDKEGKVQTQDVVSSTVNLTTTCVGAANGPRWKSKLENGSPPYAGTTLVKKTETQNKYKLTEDGPVEVETITCEWVPTIEFAGGLAIENYFGIDLGTGNVLIRKTIVTREEDKAADVTKETTTTYEAYGVTACGKTIAAAQMDRLKKTLGPMDELNLNSELQQQRISLTLDTIRAMYPFILSKVEQTINIGRGQPPEPPTPQDQQNENLKDVQDRVYIEGPWSISGRKTIRGTIKQEDIERLVLTFDDKYGNDDEET